MLILKAPRSSQALPPGLSPYHGAGMGAAAITGAETLLQGLQGWEAAARDEDGTWRAAPLLTPVFAALAAYTALHRGAPGG